MLELEILIVEAVTINGLDDLGKSDMPAKTNPKLPFHQCHHRVLLRT